MFKKISFKVALFVNIILLVVIAGGAYFLISQQNTLLEEQYMADGKFMSMTGAKAISRIIEEAIDNGVFTVTDAFDTDYTVIANFDPPKYHTKYDSYTDKAFLALLDEYMKNPAILYAVAADINGYVPTHNSRYQQPITGDKEKDKVTNRTKVIFNDPVGIKSAKNQQEGFLQLYERNTGETVWDISSPIIVKGKQWGNFRTGVSIANLQTAKRSNMINMIAVMFGILMIAVLAVFFIVKRTLQPLTEFTEIASRMADGDVEKKIVATSKDEIGELAEVLERMRISLKTAMDRLMK
jgi:HAMP domain-containing protein